MSRFVVGPELRSEGALTSHHTNSATSGGARSAGVTLDSLRGTFPDVVTQVTRG